MSDSPGFSQAASRRRERRARAMPRVCEPLHEKVWFLLVGNLHSAIGAAMEISMKPLLPALALFALTVVAAPVSAADSRNVSVINETGYAIKFLGFNAPDDGIEEWENELDGVLKNQGSTYVEFDEADEGCVWNIKVDWANYNESVLWKNVNLCRFNVLRLRYDSGTKTTSFIAE
jgi:hypothetical protein